jgi:L-alanine-DL-glutamate epimerase-like enolase superfamily enzyme
MRIRIDRIRACELRIPFTVAFRHASADRAETSSVWVETVASDGTVGYGESCPRPYVTGESIESARRFIERHEVDARASIVDLQTLAAWVATHERDIDANPAAWCAVELAILDLVGKTNGRTMEAVLGTAALAGPFQYTAVLGDLGPQAFAATANEYRRRGFRDFKIKLSGTPERDRDKVAVVREWDDPSVRVRADANNLWPTADEAVAFLRAIDLPLFALEEPIRPNQYDALATMASDLRTRIVLDESFLRRAQLDELGNDPARWALLNVRVSKMGGLIRSLAVVEEARRRGIGVVVGAQVGETSVLTRAGLTIAQAAGPSLVAQEGAFGTHLLRRDVCDPPLMFAAGGVLSLDRYPSLTRPGNGLGPLTPGDALVYTNRA